MTSNLLIIIFIPVIGALIGWLTNRMAIQMLFRPRKPIHFIGFTLQGLIPKRQKEMALKVSEIVEKELFNQHLIRGEIQKINLSPYLDGLATKLVWDRLAPKIREIPLLGSFVNDKILFSLQRMALEALSAETEPLLEKVATEVEQKIAIRKIVEERINGFDLDDLERIVRDLAKKEFSAIEWLGAVVGFLVGIIQAAVLLLPNFIS